MSWGILLAGKPASVVAQVKKQVEGSYVPPGVADCIEKCAAEFPLGELLIVEGSGHFDRNSENTQKSGSFTLSFKMVKEAG